MPVLLVKFGEELRMYGPPTIRTGESEKDRREAFIMEGIQKGATELALVMEVWSLEGKTFWELEPYAGKLEQHTNA